MLQINVTLKIGLKLVEVYYLFFSITSSSS